VPIAPWAKPYTNSMHHQIDAIANTAAQYQAYLERMRAAHAADGSEQVRKKAKAEKFRDLLDPEEEAEAETGEEPEAEAQPEPEPEAKEGFGSHYA
jgi:hypothetical protein